MTVQAGLCRTWSETTLVFPRGGLYNFVELRPLQLHFCVGELMGLVLRVQEYNGERSPGFNMFRCFEVSVTLTYPDCWLTPRKRWLNSLEMTEKNVDWDIEPYFFIFTQNCWLYQIVIRISVSYVSLLTASKISHGL